MAELGYKIGVKRICPPFVHPYFFVLSNVLYCFAPITEISSGSGKIIYSDLNDKLNIS